jgi:hypothetical protein
MEAMKPGTLGYAIDVADKLPGTVFKVRPVNDGPELSNPPPVTVGVKVKSPWLVGVFKPEVSVVFQVDPAVHPYPNENGALVMEEVTTVAPSAQRTENKATINNKPAVAKDLDIILLL